MGLRDGRLRWDVTTDKYQNGYVPTYLKIAAQLGIDADVCELGVAGGESLAFFKTLFRYGTVVGVDIDENAVWPPGTEQMIWPQDDPDLPDALERLSRGGFDLIVDDASHVGSVTSATFKNLWPLVRPGGFYVIEDWTVAFAGHAPIHDPSMLDVATGLVALFAYEDMRIEELTYRDGMIIIKKASRRATTIS